MTAAEHAAARRATAVDVEAENFFRGLFIGLALVAPIWGVIILAVRWAL